MTDEQKADLTVLAQVIAHERDMLASIGPKDWAISKFGVKADALQRIHDAISERFLDPAAEALEPLAKLSADAEWDDVPDNARADVVYRSEAGGEESVGTISFGDFRRARAMLSARLEDAVQPPAGEGGPEITALDFWRQEAEEQNASRCQMLDTIASLRAALSTSVPAGVVVPREPTGKMLDAGLIALDPYLTAGELDRVYRAMLDAAPPAQEPTR